MEFPKLESLLVRSEGGVLWVELNRPERRNTLSRAMMDELNSVLDLAEEQGEVRAMVLRGRGGHFCAGGDVRDMMGALAGGGQEVDPLIAVNRSFGTLIQRVERLPWVVIAVLEGAVMGGGFGLACVADLVLASEDAVMKLPETGLGILPSQIAPFVVQRVGLAAARRLALTGLSVRGAETVDFGLADECVSAAELEERLSRLLAQIRRCAPQANALTKALLFEVTTKDRETLLDRAAEQFAAAARGPEGQAGMMAFMQRKLPPWAQEEGA